MIGPIAGLTAMVLLAAGSGSAQELEVGGEVRPRFEVRDPVAGVGTSEFTSMRTRASLRAALEGGVTAFVQLQDVRVFGEETGTLADYSAAGLDLHQGWVELGDTEGDRWSVRVGRQELPLGGQRLVGAVNWTQQARSFDGARLRVRPSDGLVVEGLAFRLAHAEALGNAVADYSLYGLYSTLEATGTVDLFALYDTRASTTDRYTVGARWVSGTDRLGWRLEGAYQAGSREVGAGPTDISAFMAGGRVDAHPIEGLSVAVWYDFLSGDSSPVDSVDRVFDTLFATNHKFYGYMDFFLDIPGHTNRRGLQDLALKGSYELGDGMTLSADLHSFRVAARDALQPGGALGGDPSGRIGEELDLTYGWTYAPGVALTGGLSYFLAADTPPTGLNAPDENQLWGYVMVAVTF